MKILSLMHEVQSIPSEFEVWTALILLFSAVLLIGMRIFSLIDKGYKQGQIDALNGKIFYEKTENEDKEIVWTKIKKQ